MTILVTGAAGFIGSNLVNRLLSLGKTVIGFDNSRLGRVENLADALKHPQFSYKEIDLADISAYRGALQAAHAKAPISEVWHMAANSDIPAGVGNAQVDFRDTFMTTFNTVELMKEFGIPALVFASSSAVYGDRGIKALSEETGPLLPLSNYGAMKLASEAVISAATESNIRLSCIFRFPNVIGVPATHGVMLDFIRRLKTAPKQLNVLGNGTQQKAYLHVDDLIDGMIFIRDKAVPGVNLFNLGPDDAGITVRFIAEQVVAAAAPGAQIVFGEGNRGWVGDVPRFSFSTTKARGMGWVPKLSSEQALIKAVKQIVAQEKGS